MAISVVGTPVTHETVTSAASVTVNLPSGLQQDDVVYCLVNNANGADAALSESGGTWTELADLYSNDNVDTNLGLYRKVMGASPDSNVTIQQASGSNQWVAITIAFRGVDTTTPEDVATTTATGTNGGTPNPPSITPTSNDCMIVAFAASSEADDITNGPTNYTLQADIFNATSTNTACAVATRQLTGGGGAAEDPGTFAEYVGSGTDSWSAATVALRPATTPAGPALNCNPLPLLGVGRNA